MLALSFVMLVEKKRGSNSCDLHSFVVPCSQLPGILSVEVGGALFLVFAIGHRSGTFTELTSERRRSASPEAKRRSYPKLSPCPARSAARRLGDTHTHTHTRPNARRWLPGSHLKHKEKLERGQKNRGESEGPHMAPIDDMDDMQRPLLATEERDAEAGQVRPERAAPAGWRGAVGAPEELGQAIGPMPWEAPPDVERWICAFYTYFENGGCRGVVGSNVFHIAGLTFILIFYFIVVFMINWTDVMLCTSEDACQDLYFVFRGLSTAFSWHRLNTLKLFMLYCFFLFMLYWFFSLGNALHAVKDGVEMQRYYKDKLGIVDDAVLSTMSWSEVVSKLVAQQKREPVIVTQDDITALEIANIIMREDNFMIALTNQEALTKGMPYKISERLIYTRAMQFCLRHLIFRPAFNSRKQLQEEFLTNPGKLAASLRWFGRFGWLLMPAVVALVTMLFFLRHAEEFRSRKATPVRRGFNDFAKWNFREFSELRHLFKERMRSAQLVAEEYTQCSRPPAPVTESIGRFFKFVAGSLLAVLLTIALWDDTPLFFVKFVDRNLLWYIALFGMLYAVTDNLLSESQNPAAPSLPVGSPLLSHSELMRLARCTHYYPAKWRPAHSLLLLAGVPGESGEHIGGSADRGVSVGEARARFCSQFTAIRQEILGNFFLTRIQSLIEELLGVLVAPILLAAYLPERADDIVRVIKSTRYQSPNLGDFCIYGFIDIDYGSGDFYQRNLGPALSSRRPDSTPRGPFTRTASGIDPRGIDRIALTSVPCLHGKLEKSAINFILSHRTPWCPDESEELNWSQPQDRRPQATSSVQAPQVRQPNQHVNLEMTSSFRRAALPQQGGEQQPSFSGGVSGDFLTGDAAASGSAAALTGNNNNSNDESSNNNSDNNSNNNNNNDLLGTSRSGDSSGMAPINAIQPHEVEDDDDEEDLPQWTTNTAAAAAVASQGPTRPLGAPATTTTTAEGPKVPIWGYPESALRLLQDVEDFQRAECDDPHCQKRLYSLYPPELLHLHPAIEAGRRDPGPLVLKPTLGPLGSTRAGPLDGHAGRVGCSGHFFWLEILHDFSSGRHEQQLRDVGDRSRFTNFQRPDVGQEARVDIGLIR
mmetsp:Transcript_51134/g.108651  ORF Transcript_51134/g.108651 Transcript_51134/m.108651 type:complete len:1103 (+) Transcript_51134:249-3557(+)